MYIPLKISRKTQNKLDKLGFSSSACAQSNTVIIIFFRVEDKRNSLISQSIFNKCDQIRNYLK